MKRIPTLDLDDLLPLPRAEYRVAQYLAGPGDDVALARDVLELLTGHPRRYSELRPLLRGKPDDRLTRVLHWLVDHGVIFPQGAPFHKHSLYELHPFGIFVVRKLAVLQEIAGWQRFAASINRPEHEAAD